jgi:hypothetical protein
VKAVLLVGLNKGGVGSDKYLKDVKITIIKAGD